MRALVFTSLFPNRCQPNNGIFIHQRMAHFGRMPGNEVRAVAPVPYCPKWVDLPPWRVFSKVPEREIIGGIPVDHPRFPLIPKISMPFHAALIFLSSVKTVRRTYRKFPFDLIDGHFIYPDGLSAIWLGKVFRKPVVLSARGSDINQFTHFPTIRPMIRYALKHADAVISVCRALKDEMVALGIDPGKIRVISNGVDLKRFQKKRVTESRIRLGIPENFRLVLSVGHLIPRKGFDYLISAMPGILSEHPEARLYVIGEGPSRSELENQVYQLGLTGKVFLLGERPNVELSWWYNAANVFCLASSREGWANVIMEAMACGCPVVATNVYGAPEAITAPHLGTLVQRNPDAIQKAVCSALTGTWDRDRIRDHVAARDWMAVAREVSEVFESTVLRRRQILRGSSPATSILE